MENRDTLLNKVFDLEQKLSKLITETYEGLYSQFPNPIYRKSFLFYNYNEHILRYPQTLLTKDIENIKYLFSVRADISLDELGITSSILGTSLYTSFMLLHQFKYNLMSFLEYVKSEDAPKQARVNIFTLGSNKYNSNSLNIDTSFTYNLQQLVDFIKQFPSRFENSSNKEKKSLAHYVHTYPCFNILGYAVSPLGFIYGLEESNTYIPTNNKLVWSYHNNGLGNKYAVIDFLKRHKAYKGSVLEQLTGQFKEDYDYSDLQQSVYESLIIKEFLDTF